MTHFLRCMAHLMRETKAVRRVRLINSLPLYAEFYALRYRIEASSTVQNSGVARLVCRLQWESLDQARELYSIGETHFVKNLREGFEVEVASLADVLLLRLIRQGDAEELAGPHCRFTRSVPPSPDLLAHETPL